MNSSFYNGVSGVKTSQFYMDVVSNNISNVNTNGFKSSTPEVSSLFASVLVGTNASYSNDVGLGSQSQTTALNLEQGNLETTDNTFDLALGSEGWFGVLGEDGNTYYTRAGSFSLDANGDLVDGSGNYLLATSGNNIATTTLDQETMDQFGQYYDGTSYYTGTAYAISPLEDVALGSVGEQTKITLPDLLYYPPIATTEVSYGANLDPSVTTDDITLDLNSADYPATITASALETVSLSGGVSNTTAAYDPQEGDTVSLTLTDINGDTITINTKLDANLAWSISDYDVSALDLSEALEVTTATIQTEQEVATEEHFSTTIVGPDGDKDILDMTFTKVVPQGSSGTQWNAEVNIYSFYETYDPETTYDTTQYYVDKSANKVYEIIDTQTGIVTFGGSGELLSSSIPSLNNGGTAMTLDLGTVGGYDGLISSSSIEKTNVSSYNGSVEGFLTDYGLDSNGNVIANFSNGKSSAIAKVAVYHFQNDQGLTSASSNLFASSSNSGDAFFYTDANGESFLNTKIYSSTLEGSNVSLATALTELIIVQKAFDASAKSITTSDELLKNAINMKS